MLQDFITGLQHPRKMFNTKPEASVDPFLEWIREIGKGLGGRDFKVKAINGLGGNTIFQTNNKDLLFEVLSRLGHCVSYDAENNGYYFIIYRPVQVTLGNMTKTTLSHLKVFTTGDGLTKPVKLDFYKNPFVWWLSLFVSRENLLKNFQSYGTIATVDGGKTLHILIDENSPLADLSINVGKDVITFDAFFLKAGSEVQLNEKGKIKFSLHYPIPEEWLKTIPAHILENVRKTYAESVNDSFRWFSPKN